jgi:hypothetical protein
MIFLQRLSVPMTFHQEFIDVIYFINGSHGYGSTAPDMS